MDQGGSISIDFHGYKEILLRRDFELRLDELVPVEVWKRRKDVDSFSSHCHTSLIS